MKSIAVDESLSSMNQQFCSRENQLLQMLQQNEKSTQIGMFTYKCASIASCLLFGGESSVAKNNSLHKY